MESTVLGLARKPILLFSFSPIHPALRVMQTHCFQCRVGEVKAREVPNIVPLSLRKGQLLLAATARRSLCPALKGTAIS